MVAARIPRTTARALAATLWVALVVPASDAQSWSTTSLTDPDTGDPVEGVHGTNPQGFSLDLYRTEDGGVRAVFRLPAGSADFLEAQSAPELRIDDGPSQRVLLSASGLTWAAFPAWNGDGEALTGTLRELMQGQRLLVRYYLAGGGYKETLLALAGAGETIARAFGLRAEVPATELAQARELEDALFAEAAKCQQSKGKKRERCLELLKKCHAEAHDAAALRRCAAGD